MISYSFYFIFWESNTQRLNILDLLSINTFSHKPVVGWKMDCPIHIDNIQ